MTQLVPPTPEETALVLAARRLAQHITTGKSLGLYPKFGQGTVTAIVTSSGFYGVTVDTAEGGDLTNVPCIDCAPAVGAPVWLMQIGPGRVLCIGSLFGGPRGRIAQADASGQAGVGAQANVTGATLAITAVDGRYYAAHGQVNYHSTAGSPIIQSAIITNAANAELGGSSTTINYTVGGNGATIYSHTKPFVLAAGPQTVKLRFGRAGGDAATYTVDGGFIWLEDVGPV